ncbi:MAG: hypothetical protein EPO67_09700 [Reyranella sp.]|jgi:hypothetical protein|nr:MAG: hypothetical protein EPO67_09700 [Reyranella sp.]
MRLGLFLTTLVGMAGASHISIAAISSSTDATRDATWAAAGKLVDGTSPYCGGGTMAMPEWTHPTDGQAEIKGDTLTFSTASRAPNSSFAVDLKALQPDGSGRVVSKDNKNREWYVTLDPGSGARPFHVTYSYNACRRVYMPKT